MFNSQCQDGIWYCLIIWDIGTRTVNQNAYFLPQSLYPSSNYSVPFPFPPAPIYRKLRGHRARYNVLTRLSFWYHRGISSFLIDRHQSLTIQGIPSKPVKVLPGVPHGTVIGLLLFLMYIYNVPDGLKSRACLFADDCVIYNPISLLMTAMFFRDWNSVPNFVTSIENTASSNRAISRRQLD